MNYKSLSYTLILLNTCLFIFIGIRKISISQKPIIATASYADSNNLYRTEVYEHLPIDTSDIVFVGTSITERFPLNELYPGIKIKNRGIGSNLTEHILGRVGKILEAHPKELFLEGGINDLFNHIPADSVLRNYKEMLHISEYISPGTRIIVQSVFPCSNVRINKEVVRLNDSLKQLCLARNYAFLDVYSRLADQGKIKQEYTIDGTHLSYQGFLTWKKDIDQLVLHPQNAPVTARLMKMKNAANTEISLKHLAKLDEKNPEKKNPLIGF